MGKMKFMSQVDMKIGVIGDEDTVTGVLLAGIGAVDGQGKKNFLIVDTKTHQREMEEVFNDLTNRKDIAMVLITQGCAETIRMAVDGYAASGKVVPTILERLKLPFKVQIARPSLGSACGAASTTGKMGKIKFMSQVDMKIGVIGDEDTVTGMLLAGIGSVDGQGKKNFLIVDTKTHQREMEEVFHDLTNRKDIAMILITQGCAETIRMAVDGYAASGKVVPTILEFHDLTNRKDIAMILITQGCAETIRMAVDGYAASGKVVPTILEIPSKEQPYDPRKDAVFQRVAFFYPQAYAMMGMEEKA
eukprot:CAMPEP_0183493306 /NCGR_PEP_ID=MMETSP0370-20130417/183379_1 /TAXON_ID=268820 /ORGANISM="Peridinium aciculiferum, Strain PAER-2" /LENGTH=303 /DNA_ID=CAMNT_0025686647 /DNA_START=75 /DNA_END=987 /DNA_ORIENTATION=-